MYKSNNCQQGAPVGKAANQTWICIKEIVVSRPRGVALPPLFTGCKTTAEYNSAVHGSGTNPLHVQKQAQRQSSAKINMPEHRISGKEEKDGLVQIEEEKAEKGI